MEIWMKMWVGVFFLNTVYFQRTFEDLLRPILYHVLRPRRICDIYDFFAPFINLLTYLLSYLAGTYEGLNSQLYSVMSRICFYGKTSDLSDNNHMVMVMVCEIS